MSWRQFVRRLSPRRAAAVILLLFMAGDLALHLGEAFLEAPHATAGEQTALTALHDLPHGDETNCPIPGHSGGPSHHHHYPGLITSSGELTNSQLTQLVFLDVMELAGTAAIITHPGRAPPRA